MNCLSFCLKNPLRYWQSIRKEATDFQSFCLHLHRLTQLRKLLPNTAIYMRYTSVVLALYSPLVMNFTNACKQRIRELTVSHMFLGP